MMTIKMSSYELSRNGHHIITAVDGHQYYKISFLECLSMAAQVESTDLPAIVIKNVIDTLTRCITCKMMVFPRNYVFTSPVSMFRVINSMLCAARIKARRLKHVCLSFTRKKAKEYRYRHGVSAKIQRVRRRSMADPAFALCRRRLLRELHEEGSITPYHGMTATA
jgi:hypothetical protein